MTTLTPATTGPELTPPIRGWLRVAQSPWLAVVFGCLCFLNSLPNELVYDDQHRVVDNARIRSLTNFREIWLQDWTKTSLAGFERLQPNRDLMYRPFVDFTVALNYAVHGIYPAGFRLVNVLLHGLVCWLVWHFTQRLWSDAAWSTWTAWLFAVHPIHCEAVVYIVARAELLAAAFLLFGLLVLLPRSGVAAPRRALLAAPLFLVALLSKESAICYVPVALIVLFAARQRAARAGWGWWLRHLAVLLLPLLVYLPVRYLALGHQFARGKPFSMLNPLVDANLAERIFTPFTILGHYTRLFLWPARLSTEYGLAVIDPQAGPNALTWLGVATAAGLLVGLLGYFRREEAWRRVAALCAIWVASYFLISNTFILFATPLAERLAYWPSVAVFALMALGGMGLWRRASALLRVRPALSPAAGSLLGIVILAALGARALARNADWATSIGLFTKDATTYPQNAQLNANAAFDYYLRALSSSDEAQKRADLEQANAYYARALRIFPQHWGFLSHRAEILARLGRLDEAITHAAHAAQLNPRDAVLNATLGQYLYDRGRYAEAVPCLERAVQLAPDNPQTRRLLADALGRAGQRERAVQVWQEIAARDAADWQVRRVLAAVLLPRDPPAALRYAREAAALKPDNVDIKLLLAEALVATSQNSAGLDLFRLVLSELPPNHPLRPQLEQRIQLLTQTPTSSQTSAATQPAPPIPPPATRPPPTRGGETP